MATVSTNIKIDPVLKKEAQSLFESFGLNLGTAINIFLRQAVREQAREQALPFRIGEPIPNAETLKAIKDARNGVGLSRGFSSVAELMEDLNADDCIRNQGEGASFISHQNRNT